MSHVKQFYKSKKDFQQFYFHLKQLACPHCQLIGALILHGYLYGYNDKLNHQRITRGQRVFCSNRNRRDGCGRTFSILAFNLLKKFTITTHSLWQYLKRIAHGFNKIQAFKRLNLPFCDSTVYRLYKRFYLTQPKIRTFLLGKCSAPQNAGTRNSFMQTIAHLKQAFNHSHDPIAAFQYDFQSSLL